LDKYELEVINALQKLNIPAHIRGYEFIKSAMNHLRKNPQLLYRLTTELYPEVAKEHGSSPSRVERGIRTAIDPIGAIGVKDETVFQVLRRSGPFTNGEFLATLREAINVKMAVEGGAKKFGS